VNDFIYCQLCRKIMLTDCSISTLLKHKNWLFLYQSTSNLSLVADQPRRLCCVLTASATQLAAGRRAKHDRLSSLNLKGKMVNQNTCIVPCIVQTTLKRSDMDHTAFNLQRTPCLPLPRKRSPDGASTECDGEHLIAAHYSFIDPERIKGWVGLVGWPIAEGLPT